MNSAVHWDYIPPERENGEHGVIPMSGPGTQSSCVIIPPPARPYKSHQIFPTLRVTSKKFNIFNILSKFIQFYCRTKGGWKVWKVGFFSISVLTLQLTNLFVLLEGWEVSRTELEKWIYFSLFSPNLSTAIHTYRD